MTETFYPSEVVNIDTLTESPVNYNRHGDKQLGHLSESLRQFGQFKNIIAWRNTIVAGHGLVQAAKARGWQRIEVKRLPDEWSIERVNAVLVADNELARQSDPDQAALAAILDQVKQVDAELVTAAGFSEQELSELLKSLEPASEPVDAPAQVDWAEELQAVWNVQAGDVWAIGEHRLICADCREPETWQRLMGDKKANGVFTSPPYAMQRKDQYGGVETDQYVDWWEAVQSNVKANLATDGSFFVNIKAHCEDGQRTLYCMDLTCSMVRRWEWRFVDELCWTHEDLPGAWPSRFRNGFEPVYHFSTGSKIKFSPKSVAKPSNSVRHGIGGLQKTGGGNWTLDAPLIEGMAQPSNVIRAGGNTDGSSHAAAFPVALPDFFVRAYSDPGDIWVDPFLGSGTTMIAAHNNKRIGYGSERLEKYCSVILQRMKDATGITGVRVEA